MRDIHWKKLSGFDKLIFSLGWLAIGNLVFWAAILLKRFQWPSGKYEKLFNPDTYKVVYVFGWIHFICIMLMLIVFLLIYIYILTNVSVNVYAR